MSHPTRPLGVSTSLIGGVLGVDAPESAVAQVANGAITHLEYFALDEHPRHLDPAHLRRMKAEMAAAGLSFWSVHAPFDGPDLSTLDEAHRRASVDSAVRALDLASELEVALVVVHASGDPVGDGERRQRLVQLVRSLNELLKRASQRGLLLAAETLPRSCLANRAAELLWLAETVDGDLRVCYDVNHITLYEDVTDTLRALGPRLATVHISDHDGVNERHWIPGQGLVDWPRFVAGLDEIGYTGCLMHEARDSSLDLRGNADAIAAAARRHLGWG
jgi:sugar phosphate isomerase/epimerase